MAIHGVYRDGVIVTAQKFPENQQFLLIPVGESLGEIDQEKRAILRRLRGCIPDDGSTLEEVKAERLSQQ